MLEEARFRTCQMPCRSGRPSAVRGIAAGGLTVLTGASNLVGIINGPDGRLWFTSQGGVVVVEHADTQGGQVPWIFTEERGWADAADHPDLNNRPRFATARKALP